MSPGLFSILPEPLPSASRAAVSFFEIIKKGKSWERRTVIIGAVLVFIGGFTALLGGTEVLPKLAASLGLAVAVVGLIALVIPAASYEFQKADARSLAVTALEQRALDEPDEPKLAWDVARIKLESYLDRNLTQVSSIYYLTLFVMICGLALIGFGVWQAMKTPETLQPAILAALAGTVVQIIGGTILLVYRSTMAQAKDYVIVLERINAVGMSINILEGIEDASEMRDAARVQLSTTLLGMYAPSHVRRRLVRTSGVKKKRNR